MKSGSSNDRKNERPSAASLLTKSRGCYASLGCLVLLILCWSQWQLLNVSTSQLIASAIDPQGCESPSSTLDDAARTSAMKNSSTSTVVPPRKNAEDLGTWIGDQWVPPEGWKLYSPLEMQELLKDESVLFLGDSLARRLMTTFYEILNHTAPVTTNPTNTGDNQSHIPRAPLEDPDIIDRNKMSTGDVTEFCERWKDHPVLSTDLSNGLGQWRKYIRASICRHIPRTLPEEHRYWDFAAVSCYRELSEMIRLNAATNYSVSKPYSIIIIAMGAWEGHPDKGKACSVDSQDYNDYPFNIYRGLQHTLNKLPLLTLPTQEGHSRTVLWRINGYHREMINEKVHERQYDIIREHFQKSGEEYQQRKIYMLDWAKIIMPRSVDESRILGDISVHYGLDARLQLIQMMINFLVEKQTLTRR